MIRETPQGNIEVFPWLHTDNKEPKGLATTGIVLSQEQFDIILNEMMRFRERKGDFIAGHTI